MESHEVLVARREAVLQSFKAAEAENRRRFLEGDVRATSEYTYPNQVNDAERVVKTCHESNIRVLISLKRTKVGADGFMFELLKQFTTHSDDSFVVNPSNVRIVTGMSNASWERDIIDQAPSILKKNIFHHGKLARAHLENLKDALIIVDEIDQGDKPFQVLHKLFHKAKLLDADYLVQNNIRIILISATPIKELYELRYWGALHTHIKMTVPSSYIGHKEFLNKGILQEFYPLSSVQIAAKWIQEDMMDNYGNDFRVHIARGNAKMLEVVRNACKGKNVTFIEHNAINKLSDLEMKNIMEGPITCHIVLGIKGFWRRGNRIPNKWKLRIGAIHEFFTKTVDASVQVQGLVGRMTGCGNWKNEIENGHKTGPYRTSIQAIKDYEATYDDPYGLSSYSSSGFEKHTGKVTHSSPIMLSPKYVANLEPYFTNDSSEETSLIQITQQLYDSSKDAKRALKDMLHNGAGISSYNIFDNNKITTRGIKHEIHKYGDVVRGKVDVKSGISKSTTGGSQARAMPVRMDDNSIKWIGIYNVNALKQMNKT